MGQPAPGELDFWVPRSWHETRLAEVRALAAAELDHLRFKLEEDFQDRIRQLELCRITASEHLPTMATAFTFDVQPALLLSRHTIDVCRLLADRARDQFLGFLIQHTRGPRR